MGRESSWAGGGILSPLHPWRYSDKVNELAQVGHRQYAALADELIQEGGVDPEYIRSGMLVLGSDEVVAAREWAQRWSMRLEEIDSAQELQALSPGVSAQFEQGLWLPDVAQMRNPRLVRSLRASLDALRIEYHPHTPVEKLLIEQGRMQGVEAGGRSWPAGRVLIAGGAWSA
jgi:glycine oxidase